MREAYILALDLGNTWFRAALASFNQKILSLKKIAVQQTWNLQETLDHLYKLIETVISDSKISEKNLMWAGISFGGLVDYLGRTAILSHNFPVWQEIPLCQLIEERFGCKALMDNDANLGALAEYTYGQRKGLRNFIYITVSTGIGGGLILNGKLYRGSKGLAGEIGHTVVLRDGPLCTCGRRGCLESLASGTSLAKRAQEEIQNGNKEGQLVLQLAGGKIEAITAKILYQAAKLGDRFSLKFFEEAGRYLGFAIAQTILLLDLEGVILGGGVISAGNIFFIHIQETLKKQLTFGPQRFVKVSKSRLGDRIGILGAIALIKGIQNL